MFSSIKQFFKSPTVTTVTTVTIDMVLNDRESYKEFYELFNKNSVQVSCYLYYFKTTDSYEYKVLLCRLYDKEKQCIDKTKTIYITVEDFCNLIIKMCPYQFVIVHRQKHSISVNRVYAGVK